MPYYVDTSALVKLVAAERETAALREWIAGTPTAVLVTSDLARTELLRAVRRTAPAAAVAASRVLEAMIVTTLPTDAFRRAALMDPPELRTLDALHLACALRLGDDLEALITYDERLSTAARTAGVAVLAPA